MRVNTRTSSRCLRLGVGLGRPWTTGLCAVAVAAAVVMVVVPLAAVAAAGGLEPGGRLDQSNWESARGLLPPEVLAHYQRGEYANPIGEWPDGAMHWDEEFIAATRGNRKRLTVSARGSIIERATGKPPAFVYGFPFPEIDAADPQAGVKVLWNHYYGFWSQGNNRTVTMLNFVGPHRLEREISQDVYYMYYDAQPSWRRPVANPHNLLKQFLSLTVSPTDLEGTAALAWRYRDPDRRDAVWAYVPAMRRVRQVSPTNRSDGFLGSDLSEDDGPFFDGKPEDFTWRLVGEKEVLRYSDPYSLKGDVELRPLPGGGWRVVQSTEPMVGYQKKGWKGLAWAPVSMALARRRCWVIEGVPKDRYYLYGKIQLYIDRENYQGAFSRKYDWKGELVSIYMVNGLLNFSPDGRNYFRAFRTTYQGVENLKLGRATVAGPPPEGWTDPPSDYVIPLKPSFFEQQSLVRLGK